MAEVLDWERLLWMPPQQREAEPWIRLPAVRMVEVDGGPSVREVPPDFCPLCELRWVSGTVQRGFTGWRTYRCQGCRMTFVCSGPDETAGRHVPKP